MLAIIPTSGFRSALAPRIAGLVAGRSMVIPGGRDSIRAGLRVGKPSQDGPRRGAYVVRPAVLVETKACPFDEPDLLDLFFTGIIFVWTLDGITAGAVSWGKPCSTPSLPQPETLNENATSKAPKPPFTIRPIVRPPESWEG
jgi:hypothetical protein